MVAVNLLSQNSSTDAIARQRKLAELLQAQSMQQDDPAAAAPGGLVIPQGPLHGLAKLAEALSGAYIGKQADKAEDTKNINNNQALARVLQAGSEKPLPQGFVGPPTASQQAGGGMNGMLAQALKEAQTNPDMGGIQTALFEQKLKTSIPEWGETKDAMGNPIAYNKLDPSQSKPIGAPSGPAASGVAGGSQLSGEDYLKTLPPQTAQQVKALVEGRMQFPGGFALKSPYWQQMISAVSSYDPSFDMVNYNARAKTRQDFTSGKSAQNINALNTVIGHLQTLGDASDKLGNRSIPAWNTVANIAESASGDPRVKNFDATKKAVVDELTRAWRQTGGSEGDIKSWSDTIGASNSPEQLHGVISQIGDLLESKVNSLGEQYNQGMGTTKNPIRLVTPNAQKALDTLRQRSGAAPQAPQQTGPNPQDIVDELRKRGVVQ